MIIAGTGRDNESCVATFTLQDDHSDRSTFHFGRLYDLCPAEIEEGSLRALSILLWRIFFYRAPGHYPHHGPSQDATRQ